MSTFSLAERDLGCQPDHLLDSFTDETIVRITWAVKLVHEGVGRIKRIFLVARYCRRIFFNELHAVFVKHSCSEQGFKGSLTIILVCFENFRTALDNRAGSAAFSI